MNVLIRPLLAAVALLPLGLHAQVTSDISGYLRISAAANTDTPITTTFARPSVWRSAISSVSGSTITVNGSPAWTASSLAPGTSTYYARFTSGALNGQFVTVTDNGASTITVDAAGLNLGSVVAGDTLEITPYWTLGTLYPASDAGTSFVASASPLVRQTQLLFYDASATGINRAPSSTYYFYNSSWRKVGSAVTTSFDNTVVYPDTFFIQRNTASATALTLSGRVMTGLIGTILEGTSGTQNDNYVGLAFPSDTTLAATGLASNGFSASSSPLNISDRLLVFDPTVTGYNRAPSATYYYYNSGWRKVGASVSTDFSTSVTIPAGTGMIVRKATNAIAATWQFNTQL
jgi:uncharacterized protein (TIGR02597 family)